MVRCFFALVGVVVGERGRRGLGHTERSGLGEPSLEVGVVVGVVVVVVGKGFPTTPRGEHENGSGDATIPTTPEEEAVIRPTGFSRLPFPTPTSVVGVG